MPSTPAPSFSIVVNNFNYGHFLAGAIDSALAQIGSQDEVVVVDDGSTDNSAEVLGNYEHHPQVRVVHQQNQGQMKAVREGILAAERDIILLLDSDDEYLPGYFDRLRNVYREHPEVNFVLSSPEVQGENKDAVRRNRENQIRMSIRPGVIGSTRWATQLSYEFVGVPTSGISLTRPLALAICELPLTIDSTTPIPRLIAKLLRIPENEARKSGLTADGVIVRTASIMGAIKYADDRPGFMYRIHSSNKFATNSKLGQHYVRIKRRKDYLNAAVDYLGVRKTATAVELRQEIEQRSWAVRPRRRAHVRAQYVRAVMRTSGTLGEKIAALKAALFSDRQSQR